ncbi:MAG: ferredoxin [Candidatus Micrarchaeia archaeon]
MAKYRIVIDREGCIGCGTCAALCPDNWQIAEDGKSSPIETEVDEIGCNQQAADSCPVGVIKIEKLGK